MKSHNNTKSITILFIAILLSTASVNAQEIKKEKWEAPEEANLLINPLTENSQSLKEGKKLYKQQCVVCHGDSGKGDGVAGLALSPKPASFSSENFKNESDGAIFWKISNGRSPMAAYKDILTEEQRWLLITYIRSISK